MDGGAARPRQAEPVGPARQPLRAVDESRPCEARGAVGVGALGERDVRGGGRVAHAAVEDAVVAPAERAAAVGLELADNCRTGAAVWVTARHGRDGHGGGRCELRKSERGEAQGHCE